MRRITNLNEVQDIEFDGPDFHHIHETSEIEVISASWKDSGIELTHEEMYDLTDFILANHGDMLNDYVLGTR